jgi:hypothetical protein
LLVFLPARRLLSRLPRQLKMEPSRFSPSKLILQEVGGRFLPNPTD